MNFLNKQVGRGKFFTLFLISLALVIKAQDFTLVVLPDIQNMSNTGLKQNLFNEMQYIIDNKNLLNVQFVASLGDYTAGGYQGTSSHESWKIAKQSSDMIINAAIPYASCMGNHDMDTVPSSQILIPLIRFNQYYPISEFENKSYFGGYHRDISNGYYLFTASGMDFIILVLQNTEECAYDMNVQTWANQILSLYANRKAIVVTHMLRPGDNYTKNVLSKNDNIFLTLYGHDCADNGERHWTTTTPSGKTVHCIMSDYQCRTNCGGGAILRWYTFKTAEQKVYATTYNTFSKQYETDASSQFSFNYEAMRSAPDISGVLKNPVIPASGSSVTVKATITDKGSVSSARILWGLSEQTITSTVSMTNSGSLYSGAIPAQPSGTVVYFKVSATNSENSSTTSPLQSYSVLAPSTNFTIGVLPDIQNMSQSDAEFLKIKKMTGFFIDNKSSLNILTVASLGDNVYGYGTEQVLQSEYTRIKPAFNDLKAAGIPYSPCFGNHDQSLAVFNKNFPVSELQTQNPYFGGNFNGSENSYYLFEAGGMEFIQVVIETHDQFVTQDWGRPYDQPSIDWANQIFSKYPDRRGIFVTHDLFEPSGYKLISDLIKKHDNIFLALCGHSCDRPGFNNNSGPEQHWSEITNGGDTVHCIVSDYQCEADNGATVRYYTFKPSENKICAYSYNVVSKSYRTGASSQFCFDYNMGGVNSRLNLSQSEDIIEGAENGKTITVSVANDAFVTSCNSNNWTVTNLPAGVSKGTITRVNDTLVSIALSGSSVFGSYSSDITSTSVIVVAAEFVNGKANLSASSGVVLKKVSTDQATWKSYNVVMNSTLPQASVTSNSIVANLEFYESTNSSGVDKGSLFSTYNTNAHPQAFNNASKRWSTTDYPYAAISTVARGADAGETNAPPGGAVYDLMLHPPTPTKLTVCSFVVPKNGTYEITDLAVRRINSQGISVALKVFNPQKQNVATLTALNNRAWVTSSQSYNLTGLKEGDNIYFAVDAVDDFNYDATEIAWTIQLKSVLSVAGDIGARVMTNSNNPITLSQNHSDNKLRIKTIKKGPVASIGLYNFAGKRILSSSTSNENTVLDLNSIPRGLYVLVVTSSDMKETFKILNR
jgi:hypothetical protein